MSSSGDLPKSITFSFARARERNHFVVTDKANDGAPTPRWWNLDLVSGEKTHKKPFARKAHVTGVSIARDSYPCLELKDRRGPLARRVGTVE